MKNCPIFIMSADSYSDIWPVFFDLFKQYWPEYDGTLYLQTEEKNFEYSGLNIVCTQLGKQTSFGKHFRMGLNKIPSEQVLLITIDSIFMGKVLDNKLTEYYNFFIENNLDSLCLLHQGYPNQHQSSHTEINFVAAPAPHIMFSFQIAFWKKNMLYQMVLPHENPWTAEWYGTLRAEKMKIKMACLSKKTLLPINYHPAGCLHKGKWLMDVVEYLNKINYTVNFAKRGYYVEPSQTIKHRIKVKWMLVKDGLKGSYYDLWKRKSLY